MKRLLWIGDAGVPSGFARATHEILNVLQHEYDVTVLGMNYRGDPHPYPYPIYAAAPGGDMFGVGRLIWMCDRVKPDLIVVQNDGWNIPHYVKQLARYEQYKNVPVVAAVAVDGLNFNGRWLDGVALTIFWTPFAKAEARKGGHTGRSVVIPLGVNLETYYPTDQQEARHVRGLDEIKDSFIVGNVNRNQPRKRWDLTMRYFANWIHSRGIKDAFLYLHTAPTGDAGVDVLNLAKYYSILDHLALHEPPMFYGITEDQMRDTYNCFDVLASTTQGEGMGLPALEAMACGVPCLLPDWSAFGCWARDAALLVPCTSTAVGIGPSNHNVIGGVVDEKAFIEGLDMLYRKRGDRAMWAGWGRAKVSQAQFRWDNIGQAYVTALRSLTPSLSLVEV